MQLCSGICSCIDQCEHINDLCIVFFGGNLCHLPVLCESKERTVDLFTELFISKAEADRVGFITQCFIQEAEAFITGFQEAACGDVNGDSINGTGFQIAICDGIGFINHKLLEGSCQLGLIFLQEIISGSGCLHTDDFTCQIRQCFDAGIISLLLE